MSISPPSDIVLGVASAVDPEKYRAAAAQLARLGDGGATVGAADPTAGTAAAVDAQFVVPLTPAERASSAPAAPAIANSTPAVLSSNPATTLTPTQAADRELNAYKKFEAFLMQTFIETMLPKDAANVYGSGTAGEIWRSMLAEHTAAELSRTSVLGIAESIAKFKSHQKKSAAAVAALQSSNATQPAGLKASLDYLQTVTGPNAQATEATSALGTILNRSGS